MSASLIGHLGQALSDGRWPNRSRGSRFSSQSVGPSRLEPLHACMGSGSGEPRCWARSKRSSHYRLHPSRRPHGTIRPGSVCWARLDHAAASDPNRNSVPSRHIRCSTTAILRATATMARRRPLVFINRTPQAFKLLHAIDRISIALAAA